MIDTAKTSDDMTIEDQLIAGRVKRWHTVSVLRQQNIAEHSFMVMLIATEILKRTGVDVDQLGAIHGEAGYMVLRWAMWHDLVEIRTGDLPTPMKQKLAAISPNLISEIEEEFSPYFKRVSSTTDGYVKSVVKLADLIEAVTFMRDNMVDDHGGRVVQYLLGHFQKYVDSCIFPTYAKAAVQIARELGVDVNWRGENGDAS